MAEWNMYYGRVCGSPSLVVALVPRPLPLIPFRLPPPPSSSLPLSRQDRPGSMETPAACKTVDLPITPSLLKKDNVVWVNVGSKAGTRGFDGEAFWATVLEIIPATDEVRARRHDTKRNRKAPAGACKHQKAPDPNTTRVTDSAPDPRSQLPSVLEATGEERQKATSREIGGGKSVIRSQATCSGVREIKGGKRDGS
jgi:hypothetical protein